MISTRTPLRVTLGGGGTDLESYYKQNGGFIFAMALNKYIHVTAHRPAFEHRVALHGPAPECVASTGALKHDLVRAALLSHGIHDRFESVSVADIAGGTGLGSSSCFLVGFLRALHGLQGRTPSTQDLAEEACHLEITTLAKGIGKQDQYMAAFGGLTTLDIDPDGKVAVNAVEIEPEVEAAFVAHTHIYYTGLRRDAANVLAGQNSAMMDGGARHNEVAESLGHIKDLGYRIRDHWTKGNIDAWGHALHEHWENKKRLSSKVSWPVIDQLYDHVRGEFGVTGGKVIGAGGGGFLMLFNPYSDDRLESFMESQTMPRLHYEIDRKGARVLMSDAAA
jgi:D-glycero-alpha-D-manno-heptose-7-phosphate kinase